MHTNSSHKEKYLHKFEYLFGMEFKTTYKSNEFGNL